MNSDVAADALLGDCDALLIDLDGTLVLAGQPIDYAREVVLTARTHGVAPIVVTNNASRRPAETAQHLTNVGIGFDASEVISSPFAASQMLAQIHDEGQRVLIVGADALADAMSDVGFEPVREASANPVAVVQGYSPDIGWRDLAEACIAIRGGASWIATNTDTTLPTDRGLLPGNGALVASLTVATGAHPQVAGKPARPLLDAAAARTSATRPLVVGDRLDTDIAAAVAAGMPSLMVLTGVSTVDDILALPARDRPTYVSSDLRGLLGSVRVVETAQFHEDAALRSTLLALR